MYYCISHVTHILFDIWNEITRTLHYILLSTQCQTSKLTIMYTNYNLYWVVNMSVSVSEKPTKIFGRDKIKKSFSYYNIYEHISIIWMHKIYSVIFDLETKYIFEPTVCV